MGAATIHVTMTDFADVVKSNDIVLVDFWAEWCGPCRTFAPIYEQAAADNPDIVFAKVDTEAEPELAASFGIRSIPTLVVFREQVMLYGQPGALPSAALNDLVRQVRELDMDEVRRRISAGTA